MAIAEGRFDHAAADLASAQAEFGSDQMLAGLPAEIQRARRAVELKRIEGRFQDNLSNHDFRGALGILFRTRIDFSSEAAWQELWRELERSILSHPEQLANIRFSR